MTFGWPLALFTLLVLPVLVGGYLWMLRRRRRQAVRYSSVDLIRAADPRRSAWRRHLPVALLLGALACLGVAGARPQARVEVPVAESSVILALDVSGSMCATDVDPNRLSAAQDAVREFVRAQDRDMRIGLVVFAGFAQLAVAPTTDHGELLQAIDTLTTGRGTTIGAAILKSVDAIAQINPDVAPADDGAGSGAGSGQERSADPGGPGAPPSEPGSSGDQAPGPGSGRYAPEIVVLLTDGANTRGVGPVDAARVAAARGVRIYPIGFGTTNPTTMVCTAEQLGGSTFEMPGQGGGPGGGPSRRGFLVVDEPTLREVATVTGGTYFAASGADQLQKVLEDLPRQVDLQQRNVELAVVPVGMAVVLILLAVAAAVRWSAFPS